MAIEWPADATCGRCRWWTRLDLGQHQEGRCNMVDDDQLRAATPDNPMVTSSEYCAVRTHRDHGCRAWEPKE